MKINSLSSLITVLNNKTMLQKELEFTKLSDRKNAVLQAPAVTLFSKNSVVNIKDIREMLINLNFQLTDINLDIAKKLLKHRLPVNEENLEEVLKTLKLLGVSETFGNLTGQDIRAIIKDLGLSVAVFLLERNISPEPKLSDLMLRLMLRQVDSEDTSNYKKVLDSVTSTKNSAPYNYYPLNLELTNQSNLFLELFILPDAHNAETTEKDKRLLFCVDSKKLGLIKFDLGFAPEKLEIKICVDREELLGYVNQNIAVLKAQLSSRGHKIAGITCELNKQNSFSYVDSLLELPRFLLDAKV